MKGDGTKLKEIKAFKCEECGEFLDQGLCGEHRKETNHKNFSAIYKDDTFR